MQHEARYRLCGVVSFIVLIAISLTGCGALETPSPSIHATTSTTIQPYPTSTTGSTQVVYSNALTAPAPGWASGPECTFTSSGLVVQPNGGQAYICLAPTSPLTDFSVTVIVHQLSGPPTHAFGIAFRHVAPKNYYFFGIDGKGHFTFTTVVNDVSHTIIPFTAKPAIHSGAGAANRLQVVAKGTMITLLVNDVPVGQATLSTYASGTVGLRGINDGAVTFQQLSIVQV
jgi:hypothetical protein